MAWGGMLMEGLLIFWLGFHVTLSERQNQFTWTSLPVWDWSHLLRDQTLWGNISAMTEFSTDETPAAGYFWLALHGCKMLTFLLESQLWELHSFSKPHFYLKNRDLSKSLVFIMAQRKGNSCSPERKNSSSPVKRGYRSKPFLFRLLSVEKVTDWWELTDRTVAVAANISGQYYRFLILDRFRIAWETYLRNARLTNSMCDEIKEIHGVWENNNTHVVLCLIFLPQHVLQTEALRGQPGQSVLV